MSKLGLFFPIYGKKQFQTTHRINKANMGSFHVHSRFWMEDALGGGRDGYTYSSWPILDTLQKIEFLAGERRKSH